MDVEVTWGEFVTDTIVNDIMADRALTRLYPNAAALRQKLQQFLAAYGRTGRPAHELKRCLDVEYTWVLKDSSGHELRRFGPEGIGADLWMGHYESNH